MSPIGIFGKGSELRRNTTRYAGGAMLAALAATPGMAQITTPPETIAAEPTDTGQVEIIVTGNRFGGRTVTGSPTPVDVITRDALQQSGRVDLIQ